ncbi:unnamed protein product [Acanthosepion pharaonis]|uniref:Protein MMS22-like n=1 Tax=Acanthosepion pharaonis TaxID=158019 RepID=A0A812CWQ0_ACAPH|nr:unnamed protein product [Sepia pharaonis]
MDDVTNVFTCSSSVSDDDDPIIFVCNGEVNTNCLDDLNEDSCLKKGALHAFFFYKDHQQPRTSSTNQCHGGGQYTGFFHKKRDLVDNTDAEVDMDHSGTDADTFMSLESTEEDNTNSSLWRVLYDFRFPVDTALTEYEEPLFLMTRQWINYIASNAERHVNTLLGQLNPFESRELLRRRKQIKVFLNFVNQQINNNNNCDHFEFPKVSATQFNNSWSSSIQEKDDKSAVFLKNLLVNVQSLLHNVGLLSDLPKHCIQSGVSRLGNNSTNKRYHLFHLHLDIYWSVLELVFLVLDKYPKFDVSISELIKSLQWLSSSLNCLREKPVDDQIEQDFFQFLAELVVRDLTTLAWHRFTSCLAYNDFNKVSPFPCTCVKEMWIMLIQVMRYRQRNRGGRSFWFALYQVLNDMFDDPMLKDRRDGSIQDPEISFRFWMMFSLAPLYQFNDIGKILTKTKYFDANYDEIISLVKKVVSNNNQVNEEELRYYLQGCLQVCQLWKPDLTLVNILWNYFFRKLNSSFKVTTLTVTGLQTLRHTANGLFEDCCNWQAPNPSRSALSKDNSFHLFLRLVCSLLKETMNDENHSSWRNLRGRFLSKFHQRGMQELTESGLTYFTELFLTLSLCTHDDQLLEQLCDFYNMIDFSVTDFKRQGVILRGISAAMFISIKWNRDIEFLAKRIIPLAGLVTRKFVSLETEPNKRQKMWNLLAAYIEDLQDVMEHSPSLSLSEHKLITKDHSAILPVSRNYEMRRVIVLFNTIMTKLLMLIKTQRTEEGDMYIPNDHHEQMAQALWVNIFPFIETHAKTQTALPEVADLATQFFMLSVALPDWSPASNSILLKFTCDPLVNMKVTLRFFGHILDDPATKEHILDDSAKAFKDSVQLKLIQCWLNCWLLLGSSSAFQEQLRSVTQHVLCFPSVARIFGPMDPDADISDAIVELFKKFNKMHNEAKDWKTKIDLREEAKLYFSEISRYIQLVLKAPSNSDQLCHIYDVIGHLVKNCAPLLFNAPCLPVIIDSLVFPHSLFVPTKPLNRLVHTYLVSPSTHLSLKISVTRSLWSKPILLSMFLQTLL